ncbi:K+-transporting ATPase, F subunit [Leptospira inadai serovar Lyme str. 10]|uniref:K+-transporting ATPase, F subunit n=2 Tax=Leptospira inadai serovar Lyme TaxID=293084 RepID=V6HD11_9LEPT|nr:K+-transporting ATPase, F subunit [Leptospira inadai serovar Lyme str. 10]PNV73014.1 K(+)-transporting ATPase subunit F [Leptospira inadai serovar Lyme]
MSYPFLIVVVFGLVVYLTYAIVRPERF